MIDDAIAIRLLYLLAQPITSTDAYKLGIIDAKARPLKKASDLETNEEKDAYSYLHRLVFRIKRTVGAYGMSTLIPSLAATIAMLKDEVEIHNITLERIEEGVSKLTNREKTIIEDAISTGVGNVAGLENEAISSKPIATGKIFRRNKKSFKEIRNDLGKCT